MQNHLLGWKYFPAPALHQQTFMKAEVVPERARICDPGEEFTLTSAKKQFLD